LDKIGFFVIVAIMIIVLLLLIVICAFSKPTFIGITLAVIFSVFLVAPIIGLIRITRLTNKKVVDSD